MKMHKINNKNVYVGYDSKCGWLAGTSEHIIASGTTEEETIKKAKAYLKRWM